MSVLCIHGGTPLEGELMVQGAKNSVLPILAACLLAREPVTLYNCPKLTDVAAALDILEQLGCRTLREGHTVWVDPRLACATVVTEERMRAMRSSIIFLGPMLARMGEAHMTYPGGCELGPRPIDLHLKALRTLGCQVTEEGCAIHATGHPAGGEVHLALPSVGATENAMLCAVGAGGDTTITNAAREPEIVALQEFLNTLGAKVQGAGSSVISVEGGRRLGGGSFTVMGDRIVAATLLSAVAAAGGRVRLRGTDWRQVSTVLTVFHQAGCRVDSRRDSVALARDPHRPLRGVPTIRTAPYPGFPTDAQAPVMAALAAGQGRTLFVETMFDSRYRHVEQLQRMGADITTAGQVALVRGVPRLHGGRVEATDLRGGGALAVAALGAEGESTLAGLHHVDRGYEQLEQVLQGLGAKVHRVEALPEEAHCAQ